MTKRAARKALRRLQANASAKEARFWKKPRTAEQTLLHTRPVNRAAARVVR